MNCNCIHFSVNYNYPRLLMAFITVSCILLKMLPLSDETIFLPVFTVISFEDEFEVFVIAEFRAKAALRHLPSKHSYKKFYTN